MRLSLLLLAAAAVPSLAGAQPQTPAKAGPGEVKVNQLIVYGDDPCPPSTQDQINICGRFSEDDRFRIPPNLRGNRNDPASTSTTRKFERLEMAGRTGVGSCTANGPGAGAGCLTQLLEQWKEEAGRAGDGVDWVALVEAARRERLGTIDEDSEQIEREAVAEGR